MASIRPLPAQIEDLATSSGCTLPTAERPLRLAEFDDLFASSARHVEQEGTNALIHLHGSAGLTERVRDLTERETACCSFFRFGIEGTDHDLRLSISVPPDKQDIIDALVTRAREQAA